MQCTSTCTNRLLFQNFSILKTKTRFRFFQLQGPWKIFIANAKLLPTRIFSTSINWCNLASTVCLSVWVFLLLQWQTEAKVGLPTSACYFGCCWSSFCFIYSTKLNWSNKFMNILKYFANFSLVVENRYLLV